METKILKTVIVILIAITLLTAMSHYFSIMSSTVGQATIFTLFIMIMIGVPLIIKSIFKQ